MIERVKEFPSLIIIRHPLVQHKLTILRDQKTETKHFKELVDEIAMLMAYEVTKDLPLETAEVETPLERMRGVRVAGKKLALFNLEGSFYAIDDTCTHRGGPLSEGEVSGEEVTCPWHGAQFNVKDGQVLRPPAPKSVSSYPVRITDGAIEVEV